jgi:hypothetical protein
MAASPSLSRSSHLKDVPGMLNDKILYTVYLQAEFGPLAWP